LVTESPSLRKNETVSSCRHLLDALPECSTAAHDVGDFSLITINFNCTWPKKVSGRV
jgi:hypothetical protein